MPAFGNAGNGINKLSPEAYSKQTVSTDSAFFYPFQSNCKPKGEKLD